MQIHEGRTAGQLAYFSIRLLFVAWPVLPRGRHLGVTVLARTRCPPPSVPCGLNRPHHFDPETKLPLFLLPCLLDREGPTQTGGNRKVREHTPQHMQHSIPLSIRHGVPHSVHHGIYHSVPHSVHTAYPTAYPIAHTTVHTTVYPTAYTTIVYTQRTPQCSWGKVGKPRSRSTENCSDWLPVQTRGSTLGATTKEMETLAFYSKCSFPDKLSLHKHTPTLTAESIFPEI